MAVYWLTFRLENDATYNDRYNKLVAAVDSISSKWWIEATAFFLFESPQAITGVAANAKNAINPAKDLVLIGMPEFKDARIVGKLTDQTLLELMPFTKKA